ncbi:hypothetical protein GA0115253_102726 [Streptomyces sp. Termitarium-T10T-6]|nr:hypothetical protein GA0115253_102726 [Streptomyces sp. Termitarium-T10T-6]
MLPFLTVAGTGTSAGERERADGERVSALRFASPERLSLLAEGSGYWRYVPTADGIRFLTGYDYRTRWGRVRRGRGPAGVPAADGLGDGLVLRPAAVVVRARRQPGRSLTYALTEVLVRLLFVAAALPFGPVAVLPAALVALLVPPSPLTPAARRCLRRPPGRPAAAPSLLARLERP